MAVREKTAEQVTVTTGVDGVLAKAGQPAAWNKKVRLMRRDPTLGFLRDLYMAPMLASEWSVVSLDKKFKVAEETIHSNLVFRHRKIVKNVIRGLLDFGWQPFEMIHDMVGDQISLVKMKPLLQDITSILVDWRGDIRGVRNLPTYLSNLNQSVGPWVDLLFEEQVVFSLDPEGTNWYGEAKMLRAEGPYDSWKTCELSAQRFDKKVAGAHWVVYYPDGRSPFNGEEEVENATIAAAILRSLESSGSVAIPNAVAKQIEDLDNISESTVGWKIELMSASTSSASSFVDRQKYQDALKARAIGIPERAVFEGQFGTKAEAEAHADFAIDSIEMAHVDIVDRFNETEVNFLLEVNHGVEFRDKVKLVASPLSDAKKAYLRTLYTTWFNSEAGAPVESKAADWDAIREYLAVPTREDINDRVDTLEV